MTTLGGDNTAMALAIAASYRDKVARVFAGREAEPVLNGTIDHAQIVVEEAFKAAKRRVRILSSELEPLFVSSAVRSAIIAFVTAPDSQLEILLEGAELGESTRDMIRELGRLGGDRVRVSTVPADIAKLYQYNFLLVDDAGYRFADNRDEHIAVVAGGPNNRMRLDRLGGIFEQIQNLSSPCELAA